MDVQDLRQLFVKNLLVLCIHILPVYVFNPVTHTHNTRFSTAVDIMTHGIKNNLHMQKVVLIGLHIA